MGNHNTNKGKDCHRKGNDDRDKEKNPEEKREKEKQKDERIENVGQVTLDENKEHHKIHLISIIGEIEGHDNLGSSSKTTKYEHVLPLLAKLEESEEVQGVLFLLNTVGGDVSCGLALAEMIASLSKPTVSLVIGDSLSSDIKGAFQSRLDSVWVRSPGAKAGVVKPTYEVDSLAQLAQLLGADRYVNIPL